MDELEDDNIVRMEPLFVEQPSTDLLNKAQLLVSHSARLSGSSIRPVRNEVKALVASMNGYYSNLIEGYQTRPEDIESALKREFSTDPKQRDLQLLHAAHMKTLEDMEALLEKEPSTPICTPEFLQWIHGSLYNQLPLALRMQENSRGQQFEVKPGQIRDHEVTVGSHHAPPFAALPKFFERFALYEPYVSNHPEGVISGFAAHHRLTWLHPFPDGNGRVARLFSHAWMFKSELFGAKLWTLSRGLARSQKEYYGGLVAADAKRLNDYDGRGVRSAKNLAGFCDFMVTTAIDQVKFMENILAPDHFLARAENFMMLLERQGKIPPGSTPVYCAALAQGTITRGNAVTYSGKSRRSGSDIISALLEVHLLNTDLGPRGRLWAAFPGWACSALFPGLYPAPNDPTPPTIGGRGIDLAAVPQEPIRTLHPELSKKVPHVMDLSKEPEYAQKLIPPTHAPTK